MATQDDIDNLTNQIASEQQSALILDQQISAEQQRSAQLIDSWQQQARRHRDAASRMEQDLQAKQRQLEHEQQQNQQASEQAKRNAAMIARRLL